ncbi:isocyanide synthase family protein [Micromonospora sp. WMMD1082]|uniref:isocyanide synthase family protein n=1 Tax=Micromonospora sp. WMMD1082 TaxID=3016104 RepID=UPI0024180968|nr:isocyanide synthase family protein [Micromonospora sp. WMMD1082]MDG4794572.1 isocyanide synthase family protein [Micromonospora sp. WMMD1082]
MVHVGLAQPVEVAVEKLLSLVFRFRRLASDTDPCARQPCPDCFAPHRARAAAFVERREPVHFVIPAFPAKSRNPRKVLGTLPDLAERLSIDFLESFCDQVRHFYPPGARVTICSDGHVFSDVLGIPDDDVTQYRRHLKRMIGETGGGSIDTYSLDDAFGAAVSYDEMRRRLIAQHARPVEEIRERVRTDEAACTMFNGMHRFMVEDQTALNSTMSRTRLRTVCKDMAYQVILRSNAWSDLVGEVFPEALRLSIHPQPSHAEKIGFHLVRTRDSWLTPWHGVILDDGATVTLVKRSHAEAMNASLIWRNSRPSHFVHPQAKPEETP